MPKSHEKSQELNIHEQRFKMLMKLIRIDRMMKNAEIIDPTKEEKE